MALNPNRPVITIEGIKTTVHALRDLGPTFGSKIIVKATRAGCQVFVKQARRNITAVKGVLRRGMTVRIKRKRGFIVGRVGARNKKVGKQNPAKYLHLVERGTRSHVIPGPVWPKGATRPISNVQHPGSRAQRPVEQAMRSKLVSALSAYGTKMDQEVLKEVARIRATTSGSTA